MAELRLLWLPRCVCAGNQSDLKSTGQSYGGSAKAIGESGEDQQCYCWCGNLKKLLQKLKKQGRKLRWSGGGRRRSSIQCRYDPLSYSLNFDRLADEDDYHRYCAFSSRFVANPSNFSPSS